MKRLLGFNAKFGFLTSSCVLLVPICFAADDAKSVNDHPLIKTTHVDKTVGDVKVEADVSRPVVVWIHDAGFGCAAKVPLGH